MEGCDLGVARDAACVRRRENDGFAGRRRGVGWGSLFSLPPIRGYHGRVCPDTAVGRVRWQEVAAEGFPERCKRQVDVIDPLRVSDCPERPQ